MIDDPHKRLTLRDGFCHWDRAETAGICVDCGKAYQIEDQIVTFQGRGPDAALSGIWHLACWANKNRTQ